MSIEPDTKDWTWVLDRPCADCGFDPAVVHAPDLPDLIHDNTRSWYDVLDRADVAVRPDDATWSPLEYSAHVRDVHRVFAERIALMLDQDAPTFANWDQDRAAIEGDYASEDPAELVVQLVESAADVAAAYQQVPDSAWGRTGVRSNGAAFTIESLGRYHLHDLVHHVWDVRR